MGSLTTFRSRCGWRKRTSHRPCLTSLGFRNPRAARQTRPPPHPKDCTGRQVRRERDVPEGEAAPEGEVDTVAFWRCVICGASYDEAQEKRQRRVEPPISQARTVVCSAECRRRRDSLQTIAWQQRNWRRYLRTRKLAASRRRRRERSSARLPRRH